ncbi:hypothetical protein Y88_3632 [Novosphingobium nitrogenifigens DSM 19370]|uniref:Translocation and assembly module TamB C-terminal domain-containing protein n=1 Tax=Novosphingobium nitrogenifigens DSM 19370 TaxID=983920 RepID=F1ZD82_9SPHN|nr:translocation/assembly module TamB [Novosphingobium nitrogenifigens]EGD57323.1 hypothetical protein Y88_3632 [Novosphingobium nitrogenifigens DSM 19370]
MAEENDIVPPAEGGVAAVPPQRGFVATWSRRIALTLFGLAGIMLLGLAVLDSALGHRLITDRVAALKLQSGLVIHIGRIEGSLFGRSQLHDIVLADPHGRFMKVPDAELDWRPLPAIRLVLGWGGGGLDIRTLALHRGLLLRAPHLNPGDPNSPILPDFDIRIDRFAVDGLTVAPGLAGARRKIDFVASADVHGGRVKVRLGGKLGGKDRLALHLDSEPDRDRFVLDLDYRAPKDGVLAGLTGVHRAIVARVGGSGHFSQWHGWGAAYVDGRRLAGAVLDNRSGTYSLLGLVRPQTASHGALAQLAGDRVAVRWNGTFAASRLDGTFHAHNALLRFDAKGALDLARNRADDFALTLRLDRPDLLPVDFVDVVQPGQAVLKASLNGPFTDLAVRHDLTLTRLVTKAARFDQMHTSGVAHWRGGRLTLPLAVSAARIDTDNPWLDRHLAGTTLDGTLTYGNGRLSGDGWRVKAHQLDGNFALKGDTGRGGYALAGRIDSHGLVVPKFGVFDATGKLVVTFARGLPWMMAANYGGTVSRFESGGATSLLGPKAKVTGGLHWGGGTIPLRLTGVRIESQRATIMGNATYGDDKRFQLDLTGRHAEYGAFDAKAMFGGHGTSGEMHLANPVPAVGIRNVTLTLATAPGGYRVVGKGDSRLGPLTATVDILAPKDAPTNTPTRITLTDVRVYDTRLTGTLTLGDNGLDGDLALAGGGLDGTIRLAGRTGGVGVGGQAVEATINARAAKFGGDRPISIAQANITANGLFSNDNTTLEGSLKAQGISVGNFFIGRLIADAAVVNGTGSVTASLAGRRGTRFALQGTAAFASDKVIVFVAGDYAGTTISMPRRAIFEREGAGWRLEPSQISFGSSAVIAEGHFGGGPTDLHLAVSRMPLSVLDIVYADLGMGGLVSGQIDYRNDHTGRPSGHAALQIKGVSRSGLVLSSRPLDLALVASLDANSLQARAVAKDGTALRGRLQALISDLPRGGTMLDRIRAGALRAQLRYAGPADALWRMAAIDAFDLTGPVGIAADISGNLDNPQISGAVASHGLRAQSAVSGSDIKNIDLSGSFNASHLSLAHFAGTTPNGGRIVGSGSVDLSDVSTRGPRIDLRLGAVNAELINRPEMGGTISGPVRIVSDGHGGTVAGRLQIENARWALGRTSASQTLPTIAVTERNAPVDTPPSRPRNQPWKLLIDAKGSNRIDVRGMGLESEWSGDVRIRGDTANPQIFGSAEVIRGSYEFAGKRFDLSRGRIRFTGEVPIDPQLDIVATGDANSVTATISIAGSALKPSITFSSTPSLPEEELLSRILFGSSITQISAPEAVQLAAALASLRGGGGLDPINKLRGAIGLDRLRVISADTTTGRGTSLAVGKYLGRRFYVELVTDGRGYSASSIEFRLTRWIALLATVSTIDDESINLKVSKDY